MRSPKEQNERRLEPPPAPLPFTFRELVDGLLLGDGQIDPKGLLRLQQSEQRRGWLDQVAGLLRQVGGSSKTVPIHSKEKLLQEENRVIRTGPSNLLYTPAYVEMQAERKRWYPDDAKQVPRDLCLTPLVVAHWFAGDGTYDTNGTLSFCTNSFTADEVDFLIGRLANDLGIRGTRRTPTPRPNQFKLGVYRKDEAMKLKALLEPLLPDCCQYKLQHVRPPKHGHLLPEQVREIRRRAVDGESVHYLVGLFARSEATIRNIITGRSHQGVT